MLWHYLQLFSLFSNKNLQILKDWGSIETKLMKNLRPNVAADQCRYMQ